MGSCGQAELWGEREASAERLLRGFVPGLGRLDAFLAFAAGHGLAAQPCCASVPFPGSSKAPCAPAAVPRVARVQTWCLSRRLWETAMEQLAKEAKEGIK